MTDMQQPVTPQAEQPAPASPFDAPASRSPFPWETPAPEPQAAQPVEPQAEPETESAEPPADTPESPQFDPAELERLRQEAAQFKQFQQDIRAEQQRLAREQEAQERSEQFNRRAKEIWDIAHRYDTDEERDRYYNEKMAALRAETEQFYQQQAEAERQQLAEQQKQMLVSGYPDWLGQQFGLDKADIEDLRQFTDPNQMTVVAQSMKRMKQQLAQLRQTTEQAYAAAQATKQSAVLSPGNPTGSPISAEEIKPFRAGDREGRAVLARALGLAPD